MITALIASATAVLTIQCGKTDITPPEPLPLGGYTERGAKVSLPGGDRLYSRWVILTRGALRVAIASVEMLTIPESLRAGVQAKLPQGTKLLLVATHTHCAPDSQMLNERMTLGVPGIANYRPKWLDWYSDRIANGIVAGLRSKAMPVDGWTVRRAYLPMNRGRREGALPDPTATVVYARSGMKDIPVWFHFAAHAVFHGADRLRLSGDWPGAMGREGFAVLPGAIGDVSPNADGATSAAKIATFALRARAAIDAAEEAPLAAEPLAWTTEAIPLDPPVAHPDFARQNRIPDVLAQALVRRFAPPEASITALRIGKMAIVAVPGEPTSHLGRAIVAVGRRQGLYPVLVVSHGNGWMGYILDSEDYGRGGYEGTLSFYGPDQGAKVVEAAGRAMAKLSLNVPSRSASGP